MANGIMTVCATLKNSAVGICGVSVRAGSRDETPDSYGLAHFVEHTIFKGTRRRSSSLIINRMEAVGGELNAFTSKDETVVYSAFPGGNLSRAVELIADLVLNSVFPDKELDKEREVVCDEISTYLDSPADAIADDFEDFLFAGTPLGHNILGDKKTLRRLHSADCRAFLDRWYRPDNMVLFYSGPRTPEAVNDVFERYFGAMTGSAPDRGATVFEPRERFDIGRRLPSHQAHCMLGAATAGLDDPARYGVALLSNVLGGPGMNSLLNVDLRERLGLVYNVETAVTLFRELGLFTVYLGCDPDDAARCCDIVRRRIADVAEGYFDRRRLEPAKKQYLGQLVVASENRENSILAAARSLLMRHRVIDPAETVEAIKALTPDDLSLAATSLSDGLSTLIFSPSVKN
ncbi:MAG: M16 family metallopeptidase [Muribaculaceae bacterium]